MQYLKVYESFLTEIEQSKISRRIFLKIKRAIENDKIDYISTDDSDYVNTSTGRKIQLNGIKFNLKQLDKNFDINILFTQTVTKNESAFFSYAKKMLVFPILGNQNENEFENNKRLVKIRFDLWIDEQLFTHEFTHYLDSLRYSKTYNFSSPKSKVEYANSPEELNAHYQEIISLLNKQKNKISKMSFNQFLKYSLNLFPKEYMMHLKEINLKKLKNKLYRFYLNK